MKNKLLLVTLAGSFLLPSLLRADLPPSKGKPTNKAGVASNAPRAKPGAAKSHATIYISRTAATGSNIPTVWRAYDGHLDNPSNLRVYGANDLNRAGQLDVASELTMVDPAITVSRGYR